MQVSGLSDADTIAASNAAYHTCVTAGASTLKCWGDNSNGQLGVGVIGGQYATPQTVNVAGVTQVAVDYRHTCAIGSGGLFCWGLNASGQLGDGSTTDSNVPVLVAGQESAVP